MGKYEISIAQIDRHYEIIVWKDGQEQGYPEWVWGWNYAKEAALELAKQYPNAFVYQAFMGKKLAVK